MQIVYVGLLERKGKNVLPHMKQNSNIILIYYIMNRKRIPIIICIHMMIIIFGGMVKNIEVTRPFIVPQIITILYVVMKLMLVIDVKYES